MIWLYIAVGGAVGAVARYGLGGWVHERTGFQFPWGTLAVNVLGSLLIGFFLHYAESARFTPELRAMVTVGLLGAFTTFSTFSYEAVALIEDGVWARAALYSFGSLLLGLLAVYTGVVAASFLVQFRG